MSLGRGQFIECQLPVLQSKKAPFVCHPGYDSDLARPPTPLLIIFLRHSGTIQVQQHKPRSGKPEGKMRVRVSENR